MSAPADHDERDRLLRGYALGTLTDAEREQVERELDASPDWRASLAHEREALGILDRWPAPEPPAFLAERTTARVLAQAKADTRIRRRRLVELAAALGLLVILAGVLLPSLSRSREASNRASSQNNLKQIGVVMKMYAGEHNGLFPPLAPYPDVWMFDVSRLYPEYLTDLSVLVNPSLPDADKMAEKMREYETQEPVPWEAVARLAARSYTYPGYMVHSEADVRDLKAKATRLARADLDRDLHVGGRTLHRLKEGIERFLLTDINNPGAASRAQSTVPVVFETPAAKPTPISRMGANVLYMDGHVDFVKEGSAFPVTEPVRRTLAPFDAAAQRGG